MNARLPHILLRKERHIARRGVALVLTLSAVLLLSVLILAFFSKAQLDRQISSSSTSLGKATGIGRCALDLIVGELRDEIIDGNHSTLNTVSGVPLFVPIKADDLLPRASGVSAASGVLIKISSDSTPIRTSGTLTGSSLSTSAASINGRAFSSARWYTSASSPKLGSQTALPTWIFITRGNGATTPTIANAKNPASGDYVIGRFAFALYDIGALPDATVAGYPSTTPTKEVGNKSSVAFADLTTFGLDSITVDKFVTWRNAATGLDTSTFLEWSSGIQRTSGLANASAMAASRSGHRSIAYGDNTFLSRHDLLNEPNLTTAAGSLTHFSRSLNSPSSNPATATTTNSNLATIRYTGTATNSAHYRDDGTTETLSLKPGDLLLQHRFSLAKLAWLTYSGPRSDISAKAIQDCFGLKWKNVIIGGTTTPCWQYVDTNGTATDNIKTLNVVAGEGREPNFFELLKAGILNGSIGKASLNKTFAMDNQKMLEGIPDLQILRIGANIIDCADSDNYPTTITLKVSSADVPVYGVEDLPYLSGMLRGRITAATTTSTSNAVTAGPLTTTTYNMTLTINTCSLVLAPVLFNPHATSAPSGDTPSSLQVKIASGRVNKLYIDTYGQVTPNPLTETPNSDLNTSSLSSFIIPSASFETFRSRTSPYFDASSPNRISNLTSAPIDASDRTMSGFLFHNFTTVPQPIAYTYTATSSTAGGSGNNNPYFSLTASASKLLIVLQYRGSDGNFHTYDTLAGNEAYLVGGTGIGYDTSTSSQVTTFGPTVNRYPNWGNCSYAYLKVDPRTTRFSGAGSGNYNSKVLVPLPTDPNCVGGMSQYAPFGSGTPAGNGAFPGVWAEGGTTDWIDGNGTAISNVADPDTHVRPADAWLDTSNANLFRSIADYSRRPIILQRPFRSVGELGYVFRDSPWKTLNFFDSDSADSALLDLFSVADESTVTAGRVNLNTPRTATHYALLSGTAQGIDGASTFSNPLAIAQAFTTYAFTSTASAAPPTSSMSMDLSKLAKFMTTASLPVGGSTGLDGIKYHREAVIRSLANNTQTRTWNLLIDVVAQSGRYPATATSLNNFLVEGEKRYWLSIAIDRYTGKIIDRQLEPANE